MIKDPKKCPHCKSTNEPWMIWMPELGDILEFDCCGAQVKLTPALYHLTFGKYTGFNLGEVTDAGYLGWLLKTAKEKEDYLLIRCLELKQHGAN